MRGFVLLLAAYPASALCQYPMLNKFKLSEITSTVFEYKGCFLNSDCYENQKKRVTEVPPWVVNGGWRTYFFVDGRQSVLWSSPKSITTNSTIDLKAYANQPEVGVRPYIMEPFYSERVKKFDWRRNYHTIFSAQVLSHRYAGSVTLALCHSENKNEASGDCVNGTKHQNTIQANVPIDCNDPQSYSGGNPYRDGWNAYNGLLTAAWTPNNAQSNWGHQYFTYDLGPIAWPAIGYVTSSGLKCTAGLRHPSSILRGDSVYVFFVDSGPYSNNIPAEEGRKGGVKVLRVHKDEALNAYNYRIYYRDPQGRDHWNSSLPAGFTKETMLKYVAVKGPKSTSIINETGANHQVIRFSVAKLKGNQSYIGVEQYIDVIDRTQDNQPTWKVALRFSHDLITWTDRQMIIYKTNSWEESQLNYPVFFNKEGTSNTEVDAHEFYVVGSENRPMDRVNKIRVYDPESGLGVNSGLAALMMQSRSTVASTARLEVLSFPNPVEGTINVRLAVPARSRIRLFLITMEGRRVRSLADATARNTYTASFDLSAYPPGLYLLECMVDDVPVYHRIVKQ